MSNLVRRRNITSYALYPLVQLLGPACRLLTPSINKLITSLSHRIQPRFILDFRSEEGQQNVEGWYNHQGHNTRFTLLEYRKDKEGRFKHEFIVVRLNSTTICRFDRRASDDERGYALHDEGAPAEDSAHVLSSFETEYQELLQKTEVLLSIKLPRGEDLRTILAICRGIQTHARAATYSLMRYNCYFFSWMIVAGIARRTYNWEGISLSQEGLYDVLKISPVELVPAQEPMSIQPRKSRINSWLRRMSIFTTKPYSLLRTNDDDRVIGCLELPDTLVYQYSYSYATINEILRKLLLGSQVGPVLKKEFASEHSRVIHLIRSSLAENRVRENAVNYAMNASAIDEDYVDDLPSRYVRLKLEEASSAAAEILSTASSKGDTWTHAWEASWNSPPQYVGRRNRHMNMYYTIFGDHRSMVCGVEQNEIQTSGPKLRYPRPFSAIHSFIRFTRKVKPRTWKDRFRGLEQQWETIGFRVMQEWKSEWDEYGRASEEYVETILTRATATVLERLDDIAPDQLVFGNNFQRQDQPVASPSLQEFIRSRMHEHFEMVDTFGFGSFQELITTTEEAMCEIWVTSLEQLSQHPSQNVL
ncbi:hypothetical protein RSOL_491370 [Rhizoctonia solani AG-3 Rhs1AP]|uniref:Uncharacterized protein n=1 Tax=Rhizoctonia solani AG-3 Rhs1AP TaxID=1086054 RepID=X8JI94_9AGAM|nr:hypothetical protein RSOL_491370 [Rhizoctonia solani AG-3 Rhs1AP]